MRYWVVAVGLILIAAYAGELEFTAEVDRTTVGLGEPLQLTVQVRGTNISRVPRPQLPALDGFDNIGSSQSQSTSISIVQGRVTQEQTISFIYTLIPKKTGELVIGPCRLEYNGVEYKTEPITVKVTKTGTGTKRTQPQRSPFDIFEEPAPAGGEAFLEAGVDRKTVYQGEQVTATWTFYTSGQVASLSIKEPPSLTGFWAQEVYQPQKLNYERRSYRGKPMYGAVVRKTALFPTQSGELKIGAMSLAGEMVAPGFIFSTTQPFEAVSEPITIQVKPLPEAGKPASFTGGVGLFQVSARVVPETARGGEPVTVSVVITGTGNLGLIGAPALPQLTGLKVLNPETKDEFNYTGGMLNGTRRFDFPVLPLADGRFRIPEIEIGFFDPKTGSYYTRKTPALEFVATGVPTGGGEVAAGAVGMRVLGTDIRHIKTEFRIGGNSWTAFASWSGVFYILGLVAVALGAVLGMRRRRMLLDPGYARRSGARSVAHRRLKQAERLLAANRIAEFYGLVYQTLLSYVGDRFNMEVGGLTATELQEGLMRQGVDTAVVKEFLDTVQVCSLARFSPGMGECNPREVLQKARAILKQI
ncbi:protein BatD [candidate division WOR-3 bacterium]|nr:protein BatD [candidate division WOR-3 bacterium]